LRWHPVERDANNPIEADHSQLKQRLRPIRGLRTEKTAEVIIAGHAFMQNLPRGTESTDASFAGIIHAVIVNVEAAKQSLHGLALADAFGETWFFRPADRSSG
jgi:hypothetical protein